MAWIEDYGGSDFTFSDPMMHVCGTKNGAPERCMYILYRNIYLKNTEGAKKCMVLRSSNDNRASAIFFDCPACRMVALAFIWLTPSFAPTSYYTLLP
jgi:hypothetical protein